MRMSTFVGKTTKDSAHKDVQSVSHQLLLRGGYIRPAAAGSFTIMPLMLRVLEKIETVTRQEINQFESVEWRLPLLQPGEWFKESGRWEELVDQDGGMFSFKDRRGSIACLGFGPEEAAMDLMRREISSYKHLPRMTHQISWRIHDDPKPRNGLLKAREYLTAEVLAFNRDEDDAGTSHRNMTVFLSKLAERLELDAHLVEADAGIEGGVAAQALAVWDELGEERIMVCDSCGYAAVLDTALSRLETYAQDPDLRPMEAVHGPGLIGVEPLAEFLTIPVWKTTKTLIFETDDDRVAAVMVRGDCDVNEGKVKSRLKCRKLTLASADAIRRLTGAEVGYAGPINLPAYVPVLADQYVDGRINFECGANRTDYHYINVNFDRDIKRPDFGDFRLARQGQFCPRCDAGRLMEKKAHLLGQAANLGSTVSGKMNLLYQDQGGKPRPVHMVSANIDLTRAAATVVDRHHDATGIVWPKTLAPFAVHLIGLNLDQALVRTEAEQLYSRLREEFGDVLFDDREARAGEKFGDADLWGAPVRLTISKRTFEEKKLELKLRSGGEVLALAHDEVWQLIKKFQS